MTVFSEKHVAAAIGRLPEMSNKDIRELRNRSEGPEAKATLSRLVEGKAVEYIAEHRSYDCVVAVCRLRGRSVGDLMRASGVREGGSGRQ